MRILVIGAGVTGLAAAWYLSEDGHEVTVVDKNAGPGEETSFANGAQLSYSYVAPLAGPGVLPKIPPWLLRRDSPLRFSPALDVEQWRWLVEFVLACNRTQSDLTTRRLLALAFHSRALMHAFVAGPGREIEFGYATNGKLVVFSDLLGFDAARRLLDYQRQLGCQQDALDADACRALEPALALSSSGLGRRMVGAIHTPSEEVGDCYAFCVGIARLLAVRGTRFLYGRRVLALRRDGREPRIAAVATDDGAIDADAVVLASGAASPALAHPLGIRLPIYPLKGYSITVPASAAAPSISITDFKRKVVYAPLAVDLGEGREVAGAPSTTAAANAGAMKLRIAGMADIAGRSTAIDPERLGQLVIEARAAFPDAAANGYASDGLAPWSGLRPATPRGSPILGATPYRNLFLDVGQGALGWTLALGSGQVLADCVAGRKPAVPLDGMMLRG
jgi:D-amino-acid dehydrogenase